jgi:hypothetical protein
MKKTPAEEACDKAMADLDDLIQNNEPLPPPSPVMNALLDKAVGKINKRKMPVKLKFHSLWCDLHNGGFECNCEMEDN